MKKVIKVVINSDSKESISKLGWKLSNFLYDYTEKNKKDNMYAVIEQCNISEYDGLMYDITKRMDEKGYSDSANFISEIIYTLMELPETEVRIDNKLDMMNVIIRLTDSVPESIKDIFSRETEDNISKYWDALTSVLVTMHINKRVFHNMDDYFDNNSICLTIKYA